MPINKFDDEESSKEESTQPNEEKFESIRNKHKKQDFEFNMNIDESNEMFKEQAMKLKMQKEEYINTFLFTKVPVPRSPKMVDRLDLKSVTVGKGKLFGPEDYIGFSFLTLLIAFFIISKFENYHTNSFENIQNINIYNSIKPSEVNKLYEENEISPVEQVVLLEKQHMAYQDKKLLDNILTKTQNSLAFGTINDVPKVDLKKKLKENLK